MLTNHNAIILKKKDINEYDRLYTLLSKEEGKLRIPAKGVRKARAKLAGQLETFMNAFVTIAKNKGRGTITGSIAENIYPNTRLSYPALEQMYRARNIIDRLVHGEVNDPALFELMKTYLDAMESLKPNKQQTEVYSTITNAFITKLLDHLGHTMELSQCSANNESLKTNQKLYFSPVSGGVVCQDCYKKTKRLIPMSENSIKALRLFRTNKLTSLKKLTMNKTETKKIEHLLKLFVEWHN